MRTPSKPYLDGRPLCLAEVATGNRQVHLQPFNVCHCKQSRVDFVTYTQRTLKVLAGNPLLREWAWCRLPSAEQNLLKDKLMNVVANAIYYNPVLALQQLQQQGKLQHFFATWFQVCLLASMVPS